MKQDTKTSAVVRHQEPVQGLLGLFSPFHDVSVGISSVNPGEMKYALVSRHRKKNTVKLISYGSRLPWYFRLVKPLPIHTELESEPIYIASEELNGADPGTWLDRNEERLVPAGPTSEKVAQDYVIKDNAIVSASITKEVLNKKLVALESNGFITSSLAPWLWHCAKWYSHAISGPFILVDFSSTGSIFGYVKNGILRKTVNFWPTKEESLKPSQELLDSLKGLFDSLCLKETDTIVVVGGKSGNIELEVSGYHFADTPFTDVVPSEFHRAYASAISSDPVCDFSPFETRQTIKRFIASRQRALRICSVGTAIVAGVLLLWGSAIGGLMATRAFIDKDVAPLRGRMAELSVLEGQMMALEQRLAKRSAFYDRESITTYLISEMQFVVRDGVWIEEFSVNERGTHQWHVEITALALSTALVPDFIGNIGKLAGISDCRLAYSEQVSDKDRPSRKVIRARITAEWDDKNVQ